MKSQSWSPSGEFPPPDGPLSSPRLRRSTREAADKSARAESRHARRTPIFAQSPYNVNPGSKLGSAADHGRAVHHRHGRVHVRRHGPRGDRPQGRHAHQTATTPATPGCASAAASSREGSPTATNRRSSPISLLPVWVEFEPRVITWSSRLMRLRRRLGEPCPGERGRVRHVGVVVPLRRAVQAAAQRRVARLKLLLDVGRLAAAPAAPPQPRPRRPRLEYFGRRRRDRAYGREPGPPVLGRRRRCRAELARRDYPRMPPHALLHESMRGKVVAAY